MAREVSLILKAYSHFRCDISDQKFATTYDSRDAFGIRLSRDSTDAYNVIGLLLSLKTISE